MYIAYNINREKGVVVAYIPRYWESALSDSFDNCNKIMPKPLNIRHSYGYFSMGYKGHLPDTLVGKAKCHPDDEFDLEVGMGIAKDRLMVKHYRYMSRIYEWVADLLIAASRKAVDLMEDADMHVPPKM